MLEHDGTVGGKCKFVLLFYISLSSFFFRLFSSEQLKKYFGFEKVAEKSITLSMSFPEVSGLRGASGHSG